MKKFLKWLLIIIVVLILVIVIACVVLLNTFKLNDYKPQIEKAFYQQTGRHLDIKGSLSWGIFPNIAIKTGPIIIENPAGFTGPAFASIQSAQLSVAFLPLLSKQIEIKNMAANGLAVHLVQLSSSRNNWTFSPEGQKQIKAPSQALPSKTPNVKKAKVQTISQPTEKSQTNNVKPSPAFEFNLSMLTAKNAAFTYENRVTGQTARINKVNLDIDDVYAYQHQFTMSALSLSAALAQFSQEQKSYTAKQFSLSLKDVAVGKVFPVKLSFVGELSQPKLTVNTAIRFNVLFEPEKQILRLANLVAKVNQSTLTGSVNLQGFNKPHITANLMADQLDPSDYVNIHGAQMPMKNLRFQANLAAQGFAPNEMPGTLGGTLSFDVGNTTLKGVDVGDMLASLRNLIKQLTEKKSVGSALAALKQTFPPMDKNKQINPNNGQKTDIGQFIFRGNVVNGVIHNDDLLLTGARFQMKGAGTINLNTQSLNYLINAFGTHYETQEGKQVEVPDPVALPIKIKGPFNNIQYGIDLPDLSHAIQKAVVEQVAENVTENVKNTIQTKSKALYQNLKGGLKGLFGK